MPLKLQVGEDIILLCNKLEWLHVFMRDADRRRWAGTDDFTCVWVRQTLVLVLEVEDGLDDDFYEEDAPDEIFYKEVHTLTASHIFELFHWIWLEEPIFLHRWSLRAIPIV
jgi:hypothetical protein